MPYAGGDYNVAWLVPCFHPPPSGGDLKYQAVLLLFLGTTATASPESARRAIMRAVGSEVLGGNIRRLTLTEHYLKHRSTADPPAIGCFCEFNRFDRGQPYGFIFEVVSEKIFFFSTILYPIFSKCQYFFAPPKKDLVGCTILQGHFCAG